MTTDSQNNPAHNHGGGPPAHDRIPNEQSPSPDIRRAELRIPEAVITTYQRSQRCAGIRDNVKMGIEVLTLLAVVAYAIIAGRQLRSMRDSVDETRTLGTLATRQLEATDRPWITATFVIVEPFKVNGDNVQLNPLGVILKNVGHSVATNIEIYARLYPQPFNETVFAEPIRWQTTLCDEARRKSKDPSTSRLVLFPDEQAAESLGMTMRMQEVASADIIPVLFGCVDYQYPSSATHHQTRFVYMVNYYSSPKDQAANHPRLIDFTKTLPLLSNLRLDRYFFGGNSVD